MRAFQGFQGFPRLTRRRVFGGASLLLGLMTLLVACSVPSGDTTGAVALATSTPFPTSTALATAAATFTATLAPSATPTPRPQPTATPRPRPTATPRPRPTATPRPTPTPTKVPSPTPTATPKPKTVVVDIVDFGFSPASVTIRAGDTIEWDNTGSATHTSTSDSGDPLSWDSGPLNSGQTFSFTFTKSGTYTYHCSFHAFMKGTIIVTA